MAGNQAIPFNEQAKCLCYNGEILVFHLSKGDFEMCTDTSVLYVKRMVFDRETGTFVLLSKGFLNIKEKASHLKILCCKCVSDFRTRINLPCILIQNTKYNNKAFNYYILFLHNPNKFEKYLSFKLNYELDESLKIFDGPMVFWQHLNKFFYISSQFGKVTNISVNLSSIEWVGEVENFGLVFLGLPEPPEAKCTHKLSESDYEFSNSNLCVYALTTQEILSNNYLIPLAYSSVVTHVHVYAAEMVDNKLRMSLIVLTRKNQLVLFQDGIPVRVCQLPFLDPCSVQILDSGKRNRYFIVSFNSKACAVSEKTFKVVAKWEKLSLVLVNDFVGVGTEQVLVIFEDVLNTDQLTSFAITDFVRISYSTEPLDYSEEPFAEEEHENYYLVLPALEAQLEASIVFLNKLQKHISLKDTIIANSWKAFLNSIYGKFDSTSSNGEDCLVPFCDEDENSIHTPEAKLSENFQEPEHTVEQTWCHVLDDDLVVGMKVTSLKPSPTGMTLSLIMDHGNRSSFHLMKCQSQVTRLSMNSFPETYLMPVETGPEIKRIKLTFSSKEEENSFCEHSSKTESTHIISAVTSLSPLLVFNKLCCTLLLNINDRDNDENTVHDFIVCGNLEFNLQDLFSMNHLLEFPKQSIEHMEDLLSLLAILHKYCFHVTSPTGTLNLMKVWLLKHMKCEIINGFQEIYLYKKLRNCGALFSWEPRRTFEGILTVYCRSQGVLFQCLDHLFKVLPEKCFFKYLKLGNEDFLIDRLSSTLEKELVTFCSLSTSAFEYVRDGFMHQCETSETNSCDATASEIKDKICLHKREVQRERMIKDLNLKVNGGSYVEMTLALAETQLISDLIVEKLANF
ncbi:Fanconi anemia group B protein isoform X1 [Mesocricetus auratus]|uniref:Fanconi anemia group B protein isoform X1 n=1 Tax=Mesocricetus auratus TaxID=10036 RepID=A0A1U8BX68_MESAU|nr:Fanconi anemia group B protein isoform X1 [Mesocricetus auratus]XP_021085224.1 Fanconi anemia group B protein isoform X1 [Mesocricetus auratus]